MLVGILSLSSCGSDNDNEPEQKDEMQITLNKDDAMVEVGSSVRLVAGFTPSDAPNKAHTWTSENPKIATVDETGLVKGVSVGITKITATALANNATASCTVEVVNKIIAVTSVTMNSKAESITMGSTVQLTATVNPTTATDKKVAWTSSNNEIATVDADGLVRGQSIGTANITASAGGKSAVCAITVTEKSVDFSNIKYSIQADGSLLFTGTVKPVGVNISEIGVCFSTEKTPTIGDNKHVLTTTGLTVNNEISDLAPNSYYTRLYAKEGNTIYYGRSMIVKVPEKFSAQFKIVKNERVCVYKNVYGSYNYYKSNYYLTISTPKIEGYNGIKLCYGIAPNPEITDNITDLSVNTKGELEAWLTNLSGSTKYYVRAYSLINNKAIYYPKEASFTTIGSDTQLDITYHSYDNSSGNYFYSISYMLSEKGTYEVSVSSKSTSNYIYTSLSKEIDNNYSKTIYVKDEGGLIYLRSNSNAYNGDYEIVFRNLDTGTEYVLQTF